MSESDEYDEYFDPLKLDDDELHAIDTAASKTRHSTETQDNSSSVPPSPDEFDAYDLSEFSAADFEEIDKIVGRMHRNSSFSPIFNEHKRRSRSPSSLKGGGGDVPNGGPSIEIALESSGKADPHPRLKDSSWNKHAKHSPYERFRKWNRLLTVTDIVGPSWCEVQFDYGLRQRRSRKLSERPASFTTAEGKTITVARQVAVVNEMTVARGRSVHKVLEQEIQREPIKIEIKTNEERWALRIVNMLTAVQSLMGLGKCREMPVFGFVHGQIVTGIIDEVVRLSLPALPPQQNDMDPNKRPASSTPLKPRPKRLCQEPTVDQPQISTYFSPKKSPCPVDVPLEFEGESITPTQLRVPLPNAPETIPLSQPPQYRLYLSDTKTRIRPTLPPEEDTFASRMQLMLYHRLLNDLLLIAQPGIPSSQPFNFNSLWRQAEVNPTREFSDSFLIQAGLAETQNQEAASSVDFSEIHCLDDLTRAWYHAVEALNVSGVDQTLTIVYRAQPGTKKPQDRNWIPLGSTPTTSVSASHQEERDLALAIQASVSDVHPELGGDSELARAIYESLQDAVRSGQVAGGGLGLSLLDPFGPAISETVPSLEGVWGIGGKAVVESLSDEAEQLAWALQESLLQSLGEETPIVEAISRSAASDIDAPVEQPSQVALGKRAATEELEDAPDLATPADVEEDVITAAELDTQAWIIGKKEFSVDDALLDDYLDHVLAWWYGERPPQGVDAGLTRRCMSCEYRDGCEWRENKANEALRKYRDRTSS